MKNISLVETYAMTAAFADAGVRTCARDAVVPGTRMPMSQLVDIQVVEAESRKRADGNQHTFMIQTGAMGAGASGPSPWGCPA